MISLILNLSMKRNIGLETGILKVFFSDPEADSQSYPINESGLNQNTLVSKLGLNQEKNTHRVQVSRAIKQLDTIEILERRPNKIDELGKKWSIKTDIEAVKIIFHNYPDLQPLLQSNWYILNVVYTEHADFINDMIEYDSDTPLPYISSNFIEDIKGSFMYCMEQSPNFFKNCLIYNSDALEKLFGTLGTTMRHIIINDHWVSQLPGILDIGFRGCLVADSLEHVDSIKVPGFYNKGALFEKTDFSFKRFISSQYQFSWDWRKVPGDDTKKLLTYLTKRFSMTWLKNANISKSDSGESIQILDELDNNNSIEIKIDDEQNHVILESRDVRAYRFYHLENKYTVCDVLPSWFIKKNDISLMDKAR